MEKNYSTCPFNAQHIILKSELTNHKLKCPDKDSRQQGTEESREIDKQIKQYLAQQYNSNPSVNNCLPSSEQQNCWMPVQSLPVGEAPPEKPSLLPVETQSFEDHNLYAKHGNSSSHITNSSSKKLNKNQRRNAARRQRKGETTIQTDTLSPPKVTPVTFEKIQFTEVGPHNQAALDLTRQFSSEAPNVNQNQKLQVQTQGQRCDVRNIANGRLNDDQMEEIERKMELEQELHKLTIK